MTIIQLEYFLAVVNYGSFSTAAKNCFVTQPSLSMQISNLEDELGAPLLDRNSKPIAPTEVGEIVLGQAKEAIASFYSVKERVNELRKDVSGKLRLGVIPTISPFLMPKFVPEFAKKFPRIELDIRDMYTSEIIDSLNRDMIDIALLSGGYQVKIKEIRLFYEKLYFYVSPKSELYNRSKILIEEVDISQLLLLTEGNFLRNPVMKLSSLQQKKAKPRYNFVNCSLETLMHMVDATSAITIIPGMAIDYVPEEKRKQIKPFAKANAQRKISIAVGHTFAKESLVNAVKESLISVSNMGAAEFLI
jgi:LysR family hydrogen peroxide-inducible transcriptional activator